MRTANKLSLVILFLFLSTFWFSLPSPQDPKGPRTPDFQMNSSSQSLPSRLSAGLSSFLMPLRIVDAATAGACVQTKAQVTTTSDTRVVTFTCTGNSSDGTFPAIAFSTTTLAYVKGYFLYQVITDPGSTAPTDNWDYTITDANGVDVLGGTGANRHTTTTQMNFPLITTGVYYTPPVVDTWTVNISGNSVASATLVIKMIFIRRAYFLD